MKTALVRLNRNLKVIRNDYYNTHEEMRKDLKNNGYRVLKIWEGNKTDSEVDEWEFLNRK